MTLSKATTCLASGNRTPERYRASLRGREAVPRPSRESREILDITCDHVDLYAKCSITPPQRLNGLSRWSAYPRPSRILEREGFLWDYGETQKQICFLNRIKK